MKDIASPGETAEFIDSVTNGSGIRFKNDKDSHGYDYDIIVYPVYDILALHTINNQTTKK